MIEFNGEWYTPRYSTTTYKDSPDVDSFKFSDLEDLDKARDIPEIKGEGWESYYHSINWESDRVYYKLNFYLNGQFGAELRQWFRYPVSHLAECKTCHRLHMDKTIVGLIKKECDTCNMTRKDLAAINDIFRKFKKAFNEKHR